MTLVDGRYPWLSVHIDEFGWCTKWVMYRNESSGINSITAYPVTGGPAYKVTTPHS